VQAILNELSVELLKSEKRIDSEMKGGMRREKC
jgi:hypothetical protein